jgi:hypothetical protein
MHSIIILRPCASRVPPSSLNALLTFFFFSHNGVFLFFLLSQMSPPRNTVDDGDGRELRTF